VRCAASPRRNAFIALADCDLALRGTGFGQQLLGADHRSSAHKVRIVTYSVAGKGQAAELGDQPCGITRAFFDVESATTGWTHPPLWVGELHRSGLA
jgi:hypothetical protein